MQNLLFKNGDKFPILGLGTWLSKESEVYNAVVEAIRVGYRHIDCAYIYRNEKEIGRALSFVIQSGLVKREDLFITSKLWNSDHAPERVEMAIRKSLSDLQLDYLDLYLIHWPVAYKTGREQASEASDLVSLTELPLNVTWKAMEQIHKKGLARHIGVSNFNKPKIESILQTAEIAPEVNQIELHPYFQQTELVSYCQSKGLLVTAYSPLGSRHLTKSNVRITNEQIVLDIAEKHSCTASQVLLAWGMQRGTVVIPKSVNSGRILQNFDSIYVKLDNDDLKAIASLEKAMRLAKGAFCVFEGGAYSLNSLWNE